MSRIYCGKTFKNAVN